MKKKSLTPAYSLIQGCYWVSFAIILGFVSLYLLDNGFNNTQVGGIIAAAGILSAVLQPVTAGYADRSGGASLKRLVLLFGGVMLLCAAGLLVCRRVRLLTGVLFGCEIALLQAMQPLVNALSVASASDGARLDFGLARGIGSVAYAAAAYVLGLIADRSGSVAVPIAMAAVLLVLLVVTWRYPTPRGRGDGAVRQQARSSPLAFFKRYPRFALVLAGCVLLFISHVILSSFVFQIVQSKGGGSAEMGTVMSLCAIMELPVMFLFRFMLRRVRCETWFRICGIFFTLKTLGTLLVPSVAGLYTVQVLQMFGWGLISVSSVAYIDRLMQPEDMVKGQAYYTMSYTIGSVIGSVAGGRLIDRLGVPATLVFGVCCAALGMVFLFCFTEKISQGGPSVSMPNT